MAPPLVAARFHNGLAAATVAACRGVREATGLEAVALSGGVFQNLLLLERVVAGLESEGFRVLVHSQVATTVASASARGALGSRSGAGRAPSSPELPPWSLADGGAVGLGLAGVGRVEARSSETPTGRSGGRPRTPRRRARGRGRGAPRRPGSADPRRRIAHQQVDDPCTPKEVFKKHQARRVVPDPADDGGALAERVGVRAAMAASTWSPSTTATSRPSQATYSGSMPSSSQAWTSGRPAPHPPRPPPRPRPPWRPRCRWWPPRGWRPRSPADARGGVQQPLDQAVERGRVEETSDSMSSSSWPA